MRQWGWAAAMVIAAAVVVAAGCGKGGGTVTLATYTFDDLHAVADTSGGGLEIDHEIVDTRPASLGVAATQPRSVRLIELMPPPPGLDGRLLVWTVHAKPLMREGQSMLEAWVRTPDGREVSARTDPYLRLREWADITIRIPTEKGNAPDRLRLNLNMNGAGKFWIESVKLESAPLPRGEEKAKTEGKS